MHMKGLCFTGTGGFDLGSSFKRTGADITSHDRSYHLHAATSALSLAEQNFLMTHFWRTFVRNSPKIF